MGWATFWAIFSQTHLATLAEERIKIFLLAVGKDGGHQIFSFPFPWLQNGMECLFEIRVPRTKK
jgi:hypothetical protein